MSRPENPIGFVLLTHSKPHQIQRLVRRLNSMFDGPPIVIHHDFGKCPLVETDFPANVSFVRPYLDTGWGKYSIVEATLLGLAQLYRLPNAPDWCALLSGACYPIKPAAQILGDLTAGSEDAYIQHARIDRRSVSELPVTPPDPLDHFTLDWYRLRYSRYCVKRVGIPSVDKRLRPKMRIVSLPDSIGRRLLPFSETFSCYAGGHWFTINRRAACYLVESQKTPMHRALSKHYKTNSALSRRLMAPEESYFQTVLCNAPDLRVSYYNQRYIDWTEHWEKSTGHPKLLRLADLPALQASPTHFARKIDIDTDSDLLDALDQVIDTGAAASQKMVSL